MRAFKCQIEYEAGLPVLQVQGFLDMSKLEHFEKTLNEVVQGDRLNCVLDLSKLEYVNSASLGVIIAKIREVRAKGGDIRIGGCSPLVEDILYTFGFKDIFKFFNNREDALISFKA